MARTKPIQLGEQRRFGPSPKSGLTSKQRAFVDVSAEWFGAAPILQLGIGERHYFEMPAPLAIDFADRVARTQGRRIKPGSRQVLRCRPGLAADQRARVEVAVENDGSASRLNLQFHDGTTVDFDKETAKDLSARLSKVAEAFAEHSAPRTAPSRRRPAAADAAPFCVTQSGGFAGADASIGAPDEFPESHDADPLGDGPAALHAVNATISGDPELAQAVATLLNHAYRLGQGRRASSSRA